MFKEKLQGRLGSIGTIIWFLGIYLMIFMPILFLGLPWWGTALIAFVLSIIALSFDLLRTFSLLILYIWAFINVIHGPQDFFAILFYIFFGIYIIIDLIPLLLILFSRKRE